MARIKIGTFSFIYKVMILLAMIAIHSIPALAEAPKVASKAGSGRAKANEAAGKASGLAAGLSKNNLPSECQPDKCTAPNCKAEITAFTKGLPATIIVPTGPGNSSDSTTRILARGLSNIFGGEFTVENKAGGNGVVGGAYAKAQMKENPTKVFYAPQGPDITLLPFLETLQPRHKAQDFKMLGYLGSNSYVLVCNKKSLGADIKTLTQLKEYLLGRGVEKKATKWEQLFGIPETYLERPGVNFAHGGQANLSALLQALTIQKMDLKFDGTGDGVNPIPYKGTQQGWMDLVGQSGAIDCMYHSSGSVVGFLKTNPDLVALGATESYEYTGADGKPVKIPPISEKGIPDFPPIRNWVGLFSSPNLSEAVSACMAKATTVVMDHPPIAESQKKSGFSRDNHLPTDTQAQRDELIEKQTKDMFQHVPLMKDFIAYRPLTSGAGQSKTGTGAQ